MLRVLFASLFFVSIFVSAFVPLGLSAQVVGTELSITLYPEHPKPGENVTVSVESYNIDLNRADVHWFVNDKPVQSGLGKKHLDVNAGRVGALTVVRVAALGEDGAVYSARATIRPAEVNLLWQAESYTPPFYKGKALMPFQGTVLVVANPSFAEGGALMSAESLIYTWSEGDNVIGDSSGKGKNLFVFRGSVPMRTKTISVRVESPDHTMVADSSIDITPVSPRLLFYEDHPRYGLLLSRALLDRFTLSGDETRISAIPYYFETNGKVSKDLEYNWEMNYAALPSEKRPSVALRRTTDSAGESILFLEARHTDDNRSFQVAEERLTVAFPEKKKESEAQNP